MKRISAILVLLAILISCSGCSVVSLITDKIMKSDGGTDYDFPDYDYVIPDDGSGDKVILVPGDDVITVVPAPTEAPSAQPSDYKYDIGNVIYNPSDADFEKFYDMVKAMNTSWPEAPGFSTATLRYNTAMDLIFDEVGRGMFHQYDFGFEKEYVQLDESDYMTQYARYLADDVDWILAAVFGLEPDRDAAVGEKDSMFYDGDYFYRFAGEMYMGAGRTYTDEFDAVYMSLGDGSYRFEIRIVTRWEYDESPVEHEWTFVAVPMESADLGTYWRILSFNI